MNLYYKMPTDYSKIIIYHFVCKDATITNSYVGSTTSFTDRKSKHKISCKNESNKQYHQKIYQMMRENGGWENWDMVPLEEFSCENNIQARIREQYWINQLNPTMNTDRAYRTEEDKKADSRLNEEKRQNKMKTDEVYREKRFSDKKKGYEKHKDEYNEKRNIKYKTDELHRHKRIVKSKETYKKKKNELLPKMREDYKKVKDELNENRRNKPREEKDKINAYNRWRAWKKKPYETILFQSLIQKLLK